MGLLSALGKIGAGIAAPFTGGMSLAAIPAIDAIGQVAGGAAKGSADRRMQENQMRLLQQQLAQSGARDQFDADLKSKQFDVSEQERVARNHRLAALMQGLQDVSITPGNPNIAARMPQITGGLRPSALLGGGRKEALIAELLGPGNSAPVFQPAPQAAFQGGGLGENLLGGFGLGGSLLTALGRIRPQGTPGYAGPGVNQAPKAPQIASFLPQSPQLLLPSRRVA